MKRFVCLLLSGILGCIVCLAEVSGRDDDPTGKHRFGLNGALTSSDTWQMEMEYHYMFLPYIGVGGSFGMWKQYYYDGLPGGSDWWLIDAVG